MRKILLKRLKTFLRFARSLPEGYVDRSWEDMRRALKSLDTEATTLKKKEKRIRIAVDEEVEIELKRLDMQRKLKKS